jgi:signal transduction histidine kinase
MPPSQIKELAASMEKSVNFVLDLLDNILVWSMSQSDRIEFNPETINFSKYISHYIPNFESVAQVKDITFSCEIDKDYKIRADKNMLHTIIRNLVSNAVKFTDKGGSIAVSIKEEGNSLVRIAVTDTGIGMNETDLVKLFKPDTHYATIGSSREKGTGLGLILCKEFVERNGGRIWAESKPGEGSRFLFTLPRAN